MGPLADVPVRQLPTAAHRGPRNMALDAVAAEHAVQEGEASIRVYAWEPSTLTLGYAQESETVDWAYCENAGIDVTRRPTGGGGIYHDSVGDISYSIVAPRDVLPDALMEAYTVLCQPILAAFDRMAVDVGFAQEKRSAIHPPACYLRELHPSHDLVVPGDTGERKISGNAQYRRRSAVVQHGSITYQMRPERHMACFAPTEVTVDTFRDRVTAVDEHASLSRAETIAILEDVLEEWADAEAADWTAREQRRATELVDRKFGAEEWVQDRLDPMEA